MTKSRAMSNHGRDGIGNGLRRPAGAVLVLGRCCQAPTWCSHMVGGVGDSTRFTENLLEIVVL